MTPAHLPHAGPVLRRNVWGQAHRLTELGAPPYDGSPESVHAIIRWLGVEQHGRWRPRNGTTYCNVYAHDLCGLLGAYVPRVWWSRAALDMLEKSRTVAPAYGLTVFELSANALFRWFEEHAAAFGWRRASSLDAAQHAANRGAPVVIVARNRNEAAPGHIAVVIAESERCAAKRDPLGRIVSPVQSQAGGRNQECGITAPWWISRVMAEWSAWIHEPTIADTEPPPDTEPAPPMPSNGPPTMPSAPRSKSSQRLAAVREPIADLSLDSPATAIRAGEGEHTPSHLRNNESDSDE